MPLILKEKNKGFGQSWIWSLEEPYEYFTNALKDSTLKSDHIRAWHPKRQLEWMSGRFLIYKFLDDNLENLKVNESGKPELVGSNRYISLSHTKGIVGLQVHTQPIGLDIEIANEKIRRIAGRFCTEQDYRLLENFYSKEESERIIWGYKEAVYKAYGMGQVSYKNHIILDKVEQTNSGKRLHIKLEKESLCWSLIGRIQMIGPYCICQVVKTD